MSFTLRDTHFWKSPRKVGVRQRRVIDLSNEPLEPRLVLATVPLVSILTDTGSRLSSSTKPFNIEEGAVVHCSVKLTRRPANDILVSFKSFDPLDLGVNNQTLRFSPFNWNQPQKVDFKVVEDGVVDGNQQIPIIETVSIAGKPAVQKLTSQLKFNTIDSGISTHTVPLEGSYKGTIDGAGASGTVSANWADGKGVATFYVTVPRLKNFRNRKIDVDFSVDEHNHVIVQKVQGIKPGLLNLDLTHRIGSEGRGFSGSLTILKPYRGISQSVISQPSGSVAASMFTTAIYSPSVEHVNQNYNCSLTQGFKFNADIQDKFGYVTDITIAGTNLQPDITVNNPSYSPTLQSVVGVLQSVTWAGGPSDPVQMAFNVTTYNKGLIIELVDSRPSNNVSFEFCVYTYNQFSKTFIKSFFTASALTGQVAVNNQDLALHIDDEMDTEVLVPKNFTCSIEISPASAFTQYFQMGIGNSKVIAMPWGPQN